MEIIGSLVVFVIVIIAVIFYSAFAWGYVASVIYAWYILPIFPSLPDLQWWQLAGMMFFVNCFVHPEAYHFKDEVKDKTQGTILSILSPWLALFSAWVFKIIVL